jgi:hypothetical protein
MLTEDDRPVESHRFNFRMAPVRAVANRARLFGA